MIENEYCNKFLPSVKSGPINISKAKKILKFEPTLIKEAIHECVKFCLDSSKYAKETEEMLEELKLS